MKHILLMLSFFLFASLACQSSVPAATSELAATAVATPKPERVTAVPLAPTPITDQNFEQIIPLGYFELDENVRDIDWTTTTTHPEQQLLDKWLAVSMNDVYLYDTDNLEQATRITRHAPELLAFSWDGAWLLYADGYDIRVWDIAAQAGVGTWGMLPDDDFDGSFWDMTILSNNNHIVTTNYDLTGMYIWRLDRGWHQAFRQRPSWDGDPSVNVVASSATNLLAAGARKHGSVEVWQLEGDTLQSLYVFEDLGDSVTTLELSDNGRWLAISAREGGLYIFDMTTGTQRHHFPDEETASDFAFSPDGDILAVSSFKGPIHLWDVNEGILLRELYDKNNGSHILFSPDGTILLSAGNNEQLTFWGIAP